MRNKITSLALITFIPTLYAGTMGDVATLRTFSPYIVAEAAYTQPNVGHTITNGYQYTTSSQKWGGRLGAGMAYSYMDSLSFTGEIGGGYFGQLKEYGPNLDGIYADYYKNDFIGYDVLVGVLYKTQYVDIFGQVGFMIQDVRVLQNTNTGLLYDTIPGLTFNNQSFPEPLPEVKVGGIYNFTPNWGFTAAYMGVFGSKPNLVTDITLNNYITNSLAPTLNAVLFGLRYNFA